MLEMYNLETRIFFMLIGELGFTLYEMFEMSVVSMGKFHM